jgi:hypothetical protein
MFAKRSALQVANISGLAALFLWSTTALLLSYCSAIPPLLLTGITLDIGFFTFLAV